MISSDSRCLGSRQDQNSERPLPLPPPPLLFPGSGEHISEETPPSYAHLSGQKTFDNLGNLDEIRRVKRSGARWRRGFLFHAILYQYDNYHACMLLILLTDRASTTVHQEIQVVANPVRGLLNTEKI